MTNENEGTVRTTTADALTEQLGQGAWPQVQEDIPETESSVPGTRRAFPEWGKALVRLGLWSGMQKHDGALVRWVVVVPTREYAALFVAMGGIFAGLLSSTELGAPARGDGVHWIGRKKSKKNECAMPALMHGTIDGICELNESLLWIVEQGGSSRSAIPRDALIPTNGRIDFHTARVADGVSRLSSQLGISISPGRWVSSDEIVILGGSAGEFENQAKRLALCMDDERWTLNEILAIPFGRSVHTLTRVISADERKLASEKETKDGSGHRPLPTGARLAILTGRDQVQLLRRDMDERDQSLAALDVSTVTLLTESEYAEVRQSIDDRFSEWGGRWIDESTARTLLADARGAIVFGKRKSLMQ